MIYGHVNIQQKVLLSSSVNTRSGEKALCFDDFMLKSIKTLNVLQGEPMQPLSSVPPWGREVVKKHCVLMTLC